MPLSAGINPPGSSAPEVIEISDEESAGEDDVPAVAEPAKKGMVCQETREDAGDETSKGKRGCSRETPATADVPAQVPAPPSSAQKGASKSPEGCAKAGGTFRAIVRSSGLLTRHQLRCLRLELGALSEPTSAGIL